jgi:glycosyltransferase involved in cell wall biosynthesis
MALGKPVVASDVHGVPELVEAGRTGLLAPVDDDAGFARAIVELLRDPARRAEMGVLARQRVQERYNVAAATREFQEIICDAAAQRVYPW